MSSTLRGSQAFDVLLKYSDGKREKKKRIIIATVFIAILVLLCVGAGILVKLFILDKEKTICQVIQMADEKLTPCIFPFIMDDLKFHNCTDHKDPHGEFLCSTKSITLDGRKFYNCTNYQDIDDKFWCSTKTDSNTLEHVGGNGFWGFCEEEKCPGGNLQ